MSATINDEISRLVKSRRRGAADMIAGFLADEKAAGAEYAQLAAAMKAEGWPEADVRKVRGIEADEKRHKGILAAILARRKRGK